MKETMTERLESARWLLLAVCFLVGGPMLLAAGGVTAQEIDAATRERLVRWAAENPRQGGTERIDWRYRLGEGVTTRQVTYYSDDVACYAKLFFPSGFTAEGAWPAVVLGHGFNAVSLAIEKYGARFAERGLVAMVIDYRGYGFSDPFVRLLGEDGAGDEQRITERLARVELKRTRLVASMQAEDYRAAISYLQGEPGVDAERIGIWGSSHAGGVVVTVAGEDARVKAVVAQVSSVGGRDRSGRLELEGELLEDAIRRARSGQGAEFEAGFSFRGHIDLETRQTGREHRPWQALERMPESTALLFLPAENEELMRPRGRSGPFEAVKVLGEPSKVVEIPAISHFQVYAGEAFEVSSGLAAEWFRKHL